MARYDAQLIGLETSFVKVKNVNSLTLDNWGKGSNSRDKKCCIASLELPTKNWLDPLSLKTATN